MTLLVLYCINFNLKQIKVNENEISSECISNDGILFECEIKRIDTHTNKITIERFNCSSITILGNETVCEDKIKS